jgi:cyclopropane-fatty-acyl-phospholipid synthase
MSPAAEVIAALLKEHAGVDLRLRAITGLLAAEQVRVWRLYLAGGALAFEQGRMGVDQILARRPPR